MAAVHEPTHRPTTRGRLDHLPVAHLRHPRRPSPSGSGSHYPDPSHSSRTSVVETDRIEALESENASLKLSVDAISDPLDEVKEMLQALATEVTGTGKSVEGPASVPGPRSFVGMTPEKTIHTLLPWVDATTLANVVACTLDVAHFVKLIPLEQRPKGQSTAGLAVGIHFDIATMKHTVLNESTVTSEKVFPIFKRSSMHSAHTSSPETFSMSTMWDLDLLSVYTVVNSDGGLNTTTGWLSYPISSHISANTSPRMTQVIGTMSTFSCLPRT